MDQIWIRFGSLRFILNISCSPNNNFEIFFLTEFRSLQSILLAFIDNILCACTDFFNISVPIHGISKQWISRQRFMRSMKFLDSKTIRQCTWIPYFQPITKQHNLYTGITCVIPVTYCIDNSFFYRIYWQFRMGWDRSTFSFCTSPYPVIYTAHHKTCGLIYQLKHIPFVYLISRHRFFNHIPIELDALYFG